LAETYQTAQLDRQVQNRVEPGLTALADPGLVRIVLDNLLSNAWKYTRNTAAATIEFGLDAEEQAYYVRDNGAGFDMRHAQALFSPFHRLHSASEFEGTGIGLATAQRIIHRHQGRMWAQAVRNRGATFYFTLGVADEQENHIAG
jgi:light-regulated signal transduction histidine kinase (bacteriophytochrome)